MREGIALSVLTLTAGGFTVIGASVNAPLIRSELDLSQIGVGAIASMAYFGAMLTSRAGGRATDKYGPTIVVSGGLLTIAAGIGVAALAPNAFVFFLGVLLAGWGYGVINPATNVLANPSTARRRGLVMSLKQAGVPLGGLLAGAVLPQIGSRFGWRWAFLVAVLFCCGIALLSAVRGSRRVSLHGAATRVVHSTLRTRMRMPHGFGYGFAMAGAQVSIFAFTAVYLVDVRGASARQAGLGVSLLLVGGVVGRPVWGWLSDRYPEARLRFLQMASFLGAGAICTLWTVPAMALPLALLFVGICSVGWNGVYVAAVAEAGEPGEVGANTGASLAMINLGAVLCPVIAGSVVEFTHSWMWGWLFCSAVSLAGFVVIAFSHVQPSQMAPLETPQ